MRVADAADALHVDADVDPHPSSPLLARSRARRMADPDMAVGEPLGLPDRRPGLRLVDGVAGGGERRIAVRRDGHDGDRHLAQRHLAGPMDDRDAARRRSALRSRRRWRPGRRGPSIRGSRTRATRRPGRRAGRPPPPGPGAGVPGVARVRPRKPTTAPSPGIGQAVGQLAQDPGAERGIAQLEDAPIREPPETGGIIATSSPSASASVASAYAPLRANRTDGRPGARTGCRATNASQAASTDAGSGRSSAQLARARELPLEREEADPHVDRHDRGPPSAMLTRATRRRADRRRAAGSWR